VGGVSWKLLARPVMGAGGRKVPRRAKSRPPRDDKGLCLGVDCITTLNDMRMGRRVAARYNWAAGQPGAAVPT
jgi:hypothetical protein